MLEPVNVKNMFLPVVLGREVQQFAKGCICVGNIFKYCGAAHSLYKISNGRLFVGLAECSSYYPLFSTEEWAFYTPHCGSLELTGRTIFCMRVCA